MHPANLQSTALEGTESPNNDFACFSWQSEATTLFSNALSMSRSFLHSMAACQFQLNILIKALTVGRPEVLSSVQRQEQSRYIAVCTKSATLNTIYCRVLAGLWLHLVQHYQGDSRRAVHLNEHFCQRSAMRTHHHDSIASRGDLAALPDGWLGCT